MVVVGGNVVVVVDSVVEGCASNSESPDLLHPAINTTATSSPATVLIPPRYVPAPTGQPEGPPGCCQGMSGCVTPGAAWRNRFGQTSSGAAQRLKPALSLSKAQMPCTSSGNIDIAFSSISSNPSRWATACDRWLSTGMQLKSRSSPSSSNP